MKISEKSFLACHIGIAMACGGIVSSGVAMADTDPAVLEEIVVSAQKRDERLQDVPVSMAVIGGEQLESSGSMQLTDYARQVPGLSTSNDGTPGQTSLTLRGITTGPRDSATVGVYLDDVPYGSSSSFARGGTQALDLLPYDIERVEVLRGPQGTLYGASTMGGLLKYVTRAPSLDATEVRIGVSGNSMSASDDLGWGGRLGVNVPVIEGKLAFRGSAYAQRTPGYIDNVAMGADDENSTEQRGGRAALLWQPIESVSVQLAALKQDLRADGPFLITQLPGDGDPSALGYRPQSFDQDLELYTLSVNWDLDWARLLSASGYSRTHSVSTQDASADLAYLAAVDFAAGIDLNKVTQELRLVSPSNQSLEWIVGAFYTNEKAANRQRELAYDFDGELIDDPTLNPIYSDRIATRFEEYALFGDVTYRFTARFDVTAGLRWARNSQRYVESGTGFFDPLTEHVVLGDSRESAWTFMLSPRWRLNDDMMVYARIASGYRPGGPNGRLPGVPARVAADELVNYEIGWKTALWEQRAQLDFSVFYIDWSDIQINTDNGVFSFLDNAGDARSQGLEAALTVRPLDELQITVSAAYTDAFILQDEPKLGALKNDRVPYVARWQAALSAEYSLLVGADWTVRLGGSYSHLDDRYTAFESNPGAVFLPALDQLDLNVTLERDRWTARLYATNVTDEREIVSANFFGASINRPRTIGVSFDANFR